LSDSSSSNPIGTTAFDNANTDKEILDEYRRTCSIIFGKTSHSQMRFLQASIELQQSLLNSCDSLLAKQTNWLEDNLLENNSTAASIFGSNLKAFVRGYTATVDALMTMLSIVYDLTTFHIESYKKITDTLNKSFFLP
jgi:hypothetical protein